MVPQSSTSVIPAWFVTKPQSNDNNHASNPAKFTLFLYSFSRSMDWAFQYIFVRLENFHCVPSLRAGHEDKMLLDCTLFCFESFLVYPCWSRAEQRSFLYPFLLSKSFCCTLCLCAQHENIFLLHCTPVSLESFSLYPVFAGGGAGRKILFCEKALENLQQNIFGALY